jgi:hypothetical protein
VQPRLLEVYAELNRRFDANRTEVTRTTQPVKVRPRRGRSRRTSIYVAYNRILNRQRDRLTRFRQRREART